MTGFFSKLFGGKKNSASGSEAAAIAEEVLTGVVEKAGLELNFSFSSEMDGEKEELFVEIDGADMQLVTEKEGALLESLQLLAKRVLQHRLADKDVEITMDCNNFREESSRSLVELADKLRDRALEQGRSVYLRALPPKDRKVVHQHLANDVRVRSRSIGDGLYKKIKIYPVRDKEGPKETNAN